MRAAPLAVALPLGLALVLGGCHGRPGGPRREETRQVAPFSAVEISGAIWLTATADAPQSVKVKADEDLLSHLHTDVENGVLKIDTRGVSFSTAPVVELSAPKLRSIEASGATRIHASGFQNEALTLTVSGAANLSVSGHTRSLTLKTSGAGKIDAKGLIAESVTFDGSGACSAEVTATSAIDATLSGACRLEVAGHPTKVQKQTTGASSVTLE